MSKGHTSGRAGPLLATWALLLVTGGALVAQGAQPLPGSQLTPEKTELPEPIFDEAQQGEEDEYDSFEELEGFDELETDSLDELLATEVTTLLGKSTEVRRVAAAITVIGPDQIARSGARQVAEILRLAPGFQVARVGRRTHAVSSRGFLNQFTNNLLVLQDGRSMYSPTFGGTWWSTVDPLLEDLARVEVVRGPGAVYWGSNAVNGVVNLVSKRAADTQGLLVHTAWSTASGVPEVSMRYGGAVDEDTHYRVWGRYLDFDGYEDATGSKSFDDIQSWRGGLRLDHQLGAGELLTISGEAYRQRLSAMERSLASNPPSVRATERITGPSGGHLLVRWERDDPRGHSYEVQGYVDANARTQGGANETRISYDLKGRADFRLNDTWSLSTGLQYRLDDHETWVDTLTFTPRDASDQSVSVFAEATYTLLPEELDFTAGLRLEHNDFTGLEWQASVRAGWTLSDRHFLWASVARALRIPTRSDAEASFAVAVVPGPFGPGAFGFIPNDAIDPEEAYSLDLGWRFAASDRVQVDLALYATRYLGLIQADRAAGRPFLFPTRDGALAGFGVPFDNANRARTYGGELALQAELHETLNASLTYTLSQVSAGTDEGLELEGLNIQQQLQSRWTWSPSEEWELEAAFAWVDRYPEPGIEAYFRLDAQLAYRPTDAVVLRLGGHNLTEAHRREGRAASLLGSEVERVFYTSMTLSF